MGFLNLSFKFYDHWKFICGCQMRRETLCTIYSACLCSYIWQSRHKQEGDRDVVQTQSIVTKEPSFSEPHSPPSLLLPLFSPTLPPPSPATLSLVFIPIILSFQEYYVNGFVNLLTFGDRASSLGVPSPWCRAGFCGLFAAGVDQAVTWRRTPWCVPGWDRRERGREGRSRVGCCGAGVCIPLGLNPRRELAGVVY